MSEADQVTIPPAIIRRLIRDSLPDGVLVEKESETATSRAATTFIMEVAANAASKAQGENRANITSQDIVDVLTNLNFIDMMPILNEFYLDFTKEQKRRSRAKARKAKAASKAKASNKVTPWTLAASHHGDE